MRTITTPITDKAIKEHKASKDVRQLSEGALVYRYSTRDRDKGSFHLRHYQGNEERWKLVGRHPDITLKQARRNFNLMKANLYLDPQDATPSDTLTRLGQLMDWYTSRIKRQGQLSKSRLASINSIKEAQILPLLGIETPIQSLTRHLLDEALIGPLMDDYSKGYARNAFGVLRQALHAAHKLNMFKVNPMAGFRFDDFVNAPERPREPGISTSGFKELRNSLPTEVRVKCLILLMTMWGTRIGETLQMRWDWIDHSAQLMRIPAHIAKTREAHDIPLTRQAHKVMMELKRGTPASPFLFPGKVKSYDPSTMSKHLKTVSNGAWKSHDLRKLMRSKLSELGVENWLAERLINHKQTGLDAIYNRGDIEAQKRAAMTKYHDWLGSISWFDAIRDNPEIEPNRRNETSPEPKRLAG